MDPLPGMLNTKKGFGVIYTPKPIVEMILDEVSGDLKNVAVCDPACGDGAFLIPFAIRVVEKIKNAKNAKKPTKSYYKTLEQLTGFDIDEEALRECRTRLNAVMDQNGIKAPDWRLHRIDAMDRSAWEPWQGSFHAVVGNPPYVRVQHLESFRRNLIQAGSWKFMNGAYDLFLLFFEMGFDLLKPGCNLAYITPNSWLRSESGRGLREHLREHHRVKALYDFGQHQVFANATTYAAISVIEKGGAPSDRDIPVHQCQGFRDGVPEWIKGRYVRPDDDVWNPMSVSERNVFALDGPKLGDIADIHVGIQTLADSVFIFPTGQLDIEPEVVRPIYKVSRMKNGRDAVNRSIIYPYEDGRLIAEDIFAERYPKAFRYLQDRKDELMARDKGKISEHRWYGYGRDVSIVKGFGKKILTSSMNAKPNFMKCRNPKALFYSGYCIKPHKGVDMKRLLECLNSNEMSQFIHLTSRPFQGGWFSYAKSYIQNFPIPREVLAHV